MEPTRCIPDERLAAFFDGELAPDEGSAVERHLADCARCRRIVDEMYLARQGIRSVSTPAPPDALWAGIEKEMTASRPTPLPLFRAAGAHGRSLLRERRLALAAAVAVLALTSLFLMSRSDLLPSGGGLVADRAGELPVLAASAPFNLGPFLQALDRTNRIPSFSDAYRQTPVAPKDAISRIVENVEIDWAALSADVALESASMVERGGYRMAQLIFSHADGKVVVFVQPRGYSISFANHPTEPTVLGRRRCLKVRCGDYRAYCFRTDEATYTVIGRHDDPMLEAIYSAVADR